jgi:hypothetical protein
LICIVVHNEWIGVAVALRTKKEWKIGKQTPIRVVGAPPLEEIQEWRNGTARPTKGHFCLGLKARLNGQT